MRDVAFYEQIVRADTMRYIFAAYHMVPTLVAISATDLPYETREDIKSFLPTKISAIKRVREETGLGLKESLNFVNVVWATLDCASQ